MKKPKISIYSDKARAFQKRMVKQYFMLSPKEANVYLYLGSRDSDDPNINDIQNKVFFEVPDRAYNPEPVTVSIMMEPIPESPMDFSRFGIINPIGDELVLRIHEDEMACLGRPLVVGDVMEIPFYARGCEKKAFFEVTDVDEKPTYEKFYYVVRIVVMNDSRKTREIPVDDRSNTGIMDDIMAGFEERVEEQVPFPGLEENTNPVDYRSKNQKSFLDDPTKVFNDKDEE